MHHPGLLRCTTVFLLSLAGLIAAPAGAETLTLEQALDIALDKNRKLANAGLEVDKADQSIQAERSKFLPRLNVDVSGHYNLTPQSFTYEAGAFGPVPTEEVQITSEGGFTTIVSAGVKQPLAQLYRTGLAVDQLEVSRDISDEQLRASRQDVSKRVKKAYYDILKTQLSLEATNERIVFYRELAKVVDNYFAQQTVLEYETLEVRSRLARAEHDVLTETNRMETLQEKLNLLLGRDVSKRFSVNSVGVNDKPLPTVADAEALALAQRPEIRASELKLDHAKYGYRIKQSEYIPELDLEFRYTRLFGTDFIPDEESKVGLKLRWDIYDWGRKSDDLSKKQYTIKQSRNEIEETQARVLIDVNDRLRKAKSAREFSEVTRIGQAAAREKVRVLMNQYKQRAVLLDDLLRAEADLTDANTEHFHALLAVWTAQAELEKAIGEE